MPQLNQFVNSMTMGGARANQFAVEITGAGDRLASSTFAFLCRSAQIPALTMGEVAVPYRGRQIFLPGDRTYDAWTITIFNDGEMSIRDSLERWQNDIQDIGNSTNTSVEKFDRTAKVYQLSKNQDTVNGNKQFIRVYNLHGVWPTSIDAIDLAYDTNDVIEEFGVTFRFNYMTATPGHAGGRSISSGGTIGTSDGSDSSSSSVLGTIGNVSRNIQNLLNMFTG